MPEMSSKKSETPATKKDLNRWATKLRKDSRKDLGVAVKRLEAGQGALDASVKRLEAGQDSLGARVKRLEAGQGALDAAVKRLAFEIVKTNGRIDQLESSLRKDMARHVDRIVTTVDTFAKRSEAQYRAVVLHGEMLLRHSDRFEGHERRLSSLEARR